MDYRHSGRSEELNQSGSRGCPGWLEVRREHQERAPGGLQRAPPGFTTLQRPTRGAHTRAYGNTHTRLFDEAEDKHALNVHAGCVHRMVGLTRSISHEGWNVRAIDCAYILLLGVPVIYREKACLGSRLVATIRHRVLLDGCF